MKQLWVRREGGSKMVLTMLVWGVLTVMVTRVYLSLMNWPAIAWGEWHIAHVLWGGLLMVATMIIVLAFEGQRILKNMAVLFGVGFGLFIDEIGKYLTRDNDYWFRPAFIFIYVSFVLIFLFYKYLDRQTKKTDKEVFYSILR
ncbi:hypothetical protein KBC75_06110, partial [Candidatus Shapirobacteria bacterium]|nr:hypothetical protein [Candidatus Shapirobacteria bacterium]